MNHQLKTREGQLISSLGICQFCSTVLCVSDIPPEVDIRGAHCPTCNKGPLDFELSWGVGPDPTDTSDRPNYVHLKWVGPDSKWTNRIPEHDFPLPRLGVIGVK